MPPDARSGGSGRSAARPAEEPWRSAFAWIETELGGSVVRAERQARWRPAWFLELQRGDALLPLYFRGERPEAGSGAYGLEREMRVLQVLEAHGVPVPHVYGLCPEPRGIVMQRCPGRANLATATDEAERVAVLDHYVEILADVHRIDVAAFEAVGLSRPRTPEQRGLLDFDVWEQGYRKRKRRPEPAIEFLIRWVRRNLPRDRERVSFVCSDSGQFLFERGRVTALLDLELACLGDPAADLGGLRTRDLSEPLGDLSRALRRYAELTAEPVDPVAVDHHTVRFALVTPLAVAHLVAEPPPGMDVIQYLAWYLVYTRAPLEVIADGMGIEVAAPPRSREAPPAVAVGDAGFAGYRAGAEARLAAYRERRQRLGPELSAEDLDDVAGLLGSRPQTRAEADAQLEAFVCTAGPERDAELVALLHRRVWRDEQILEPLLRELRGARIQRLRLVS